MIHRLFLAILLSVLMVSACCAEFNVRDFGAVGDGVADDTAAFQSALDEAGKAGGGIVNVPAGVYRINGNLTVPGAVTLQGIFRVPPVVVGGKITGVSGSILHAYAGRGSEEGKPFITLGGNAATVAGLTIVYPEWKQTDVPPVPYPPCIANNGPVENVGVLDCNLVNPYEGIRFVWAGRHFIRNVYGYPIKRGIFVDDCYDIGRIENVHFWPFGVHYKPDDPYCKWVNVNGVCMEFARTDWQYVTNTFCFGYGVGYKFSQSKSGSANGNFLGIGADWCGRAVLVEESQGPGLLITNGEFVGGDKADAYVELTPTHTGVVQFSNCSFWGPCPTIAIIDGNGAASFNQCNFNNWGGDQKAWSIDARGGDITIQTCRFGPNRPDIKLDKGVKTAVIMGNRFTESKEIENNSEGDVQEGLNVVSK